MESLSSTAANSPQLIIVASCHATDRHRNSLRAGCRAACQPFVPTEIHLITTDNGAEKARLARLTTEPGWFHRLCRDYALPPIRFDSNTVTVCHSIPSASARHLNCLKRLNCRRPRKSSMPPANSSSSHRTPPTRTPPSPGASGNATTGARRAPTANSASGWPARRPPATTSPAAVSANSSSGCSPRSTWPSTSVSTSAPTVRRPLSATATHGVSSTASLHFAPQSASASRLGRQYQECPERHRRSGAPCEVARRRVEVAIRMKARPRRLTGPSPS